MIQVTDESLALRAATGDRQAFGTLIERHYERIYQIGVLVLCDVNEAEDLAQDVCVALPGKLSSWRRESPFVHWLCRVTVNAARDALRKRASRARNERSYAELEVMRQVGARARAADAAWLQNALGGLPEDLRVTVALVIEERMRHAEAGAVLGVSESTVSWRMHEARKRLRALAECEEQSG